MTTSNYYDDKAKVNVWVDKEIYKQARTAAIQNEIKWSKFIEMALELLIEQLEQQQRQN